VPAISSRPHLYHFRLRHRQSQPRRQSRTQQFVRQDPQPLRMVLEFHHVARLIRAAHQMRLRPTTHSPHLFERQRHPARMLTADKPARQGNYFHTGNVPQRCTTASRRASCFESAHAGGFIRLRATRNNPTVKQANRKQRNRELNFAGRGGAVKSRAAQKKRGTATPL
jgi:hypothetical protein